MLATAAFGGVTDTLYLSAGFGSGHGQLSENSALVYDDYSKVPLPYAREVGGLANLRIGLVLTPRVRIALESCAWSTERDMTAIGVSVEWMFGHVDCRLGYALGASHVDYIERGDLKRAFDFGPGAILGLGYEQTITTHWALVPQVVYFGHLGKDPEIWADSYGLMLNLTYFIGE